MYIVKKNINGKDYYYLRKSIRENGKVKSKCIAYLSKDKKEAEEKAKEIINQMEKDKINEKEKIREVKENKTNDFSKLTIEELNNFCKKKGFVYPSGEIYGGLQGFWDFGHLGSELKKNIKDLWWKFHVYREDIIGIDGSIITNPKVWEASGHVSNFIDIAVVCKKCNKKNKIDKHELGKVKCECGGEYIEKGEFNPMFITYVGPIKNESIKVYLRPETAQLIFSNFKSIAENSRMKLPFGIAQIGKSFRNELSPREFLFRLREFEQMEIEYFIKKDMKCPYIEEIKDIEILVYNEDMQENNLKPEKMKIYNAWKKGIIKTDWHAYWIAQEYKWFILLGANPKKFRIRQHTSDEKSHYAIDTWDLEYKFPMGWRELQGFANRGNFDLTQHQKYSGKSMELNNEKIIPEVVCEPSLGVERAFLVFLFDSYFYDEERKNVVLKLNPKLAPIKAAVFPLVKNDEQINLCKKILKDLRKEFNVVYDVSGSIGRRYSRNDEIGTPYCITIDEQSLKNNDVTIRDRDTKKQIRVKINLLQKILKDLIEKNIDFKKTGILIN